MSSPSLAEAAVVGLAGACGTTTSTAAEVAEPSEEELEIARELVRAALPGGSR